MSKEIKSPKVMDTNYIRLAQIYHVLQTGRSDQYFDNEKKLMYINAIINYPDFDGNYKLPSDSFICQSYPHYSGNTLTHLMVELKKFPGYYFEDLIERDIGLAIENDDGYTPLLLAIIKDIKIDKILNTYNQRKILNNFYSKHGLSHFHVACATSMTEIIDHYLKTGVSVNERVNYDSPKFGGYTPLHFAIEYCQPQTIEFLLKNGANLSCKDSNGLTPLHLLIKKFLQNKVSKYDDVQKFLQDTVSNNLFNLPDNVGFTLTHWQSILGTFKNEKEIKIDATINLDSPVFPGYTPLHFAAQLNFQTVILLLKAGADLLAQDVNDTTPLALCLRKFNKDQIIELLLVEKRHQLSKLKFTNGVIILEALQAMQKNDEFEKYLKQKFGDINNTIPLDSPIWPGCSLLHLVVIFNGPVDKILACPKINHAIQDAKGMSPLHIAFRINRERIITILLNSLTSTSFFSLLKWITQFIQTSDRTFTSSYPNDPDNLSYLHIACAAKNIEAVKLLLEKGADPNLQTLCDFQWKNCDVIKAGSTPLHIAVYLACKENFDFVNVLLEYGAKPNVTNANDVMPYDISLWYQKEKILDMMLKSNKEFDCEKEYEKLGWTRLHFACFKHDLSMVKEELESGADVNKQISFDSKIWPGDTALHILCRKRFDSKNDFIQLLLAHGADPCLQNASSSTPFHISINMFYTTTHFLGDNFYSKNPVNNQGLSHFHGACIANNLLAVENYLKSGINVNTAIDYFAYRWPGFTALHFAVWNDSVELIELLFNYGADHNIISTEGYTPLHLAVATEKHDSLRKLISYPTVDIQAKNLFGDTALEMNLRMFHKNDEAAKILLEKGACLNFARLTDNSYGKTLISHAVENIQDSKIFLKLISTVPDITISDDKGNNLIHHIASDDYHDETDFQLVNRRIEILVDLGCEIDHKNNEGKTPLHFAVYFYNEQMCETLLDLGADVNIKDDDKKIPYFYDSDDACKLVIIKHIVKLARVGFNIDKSDELKSDALACMIRRKNHFLEDDHPTIPKEKEELDFWLKMEINPTFSTAYLFSNQFLKDIKSIPESQRQKMLDYCRSKDWQNRFPVLHTLIKVQFKRARTWNRLLVPAANSFQALSGLAIPEMCLEVVNYLDIDSLMNLVRAANGKLEFAPLIQNN